MTQVCLMNNAWLLMRDSAARTSSVKYHVERRTLFSKSGVVLTGAGGRGSCRARGASAVGRERGGVHTLARLLGAADSLLDEAARRDSGRCGIRSRMVPEVNWREFPENRTLPQLCTQGLRPPSRSCPRPTVTMARPARSLPGSSSTRPKAAACSRARKRDVRFLRVAHRGRWRVRRSLSRVTRTRASRRAEPMIARSPGFPRSSPPPMSRHDRRPRGRLGRRPTRTSPRAASRRFPFDLKRFDDLVIDKPGSRIRCMR